MAGVFPNEVSIYIAPADTDGSSLTAAHMVVGEITNLSLSGGAQDIESIPVIGGFVDKEMPREQFEVSFDVIVSNTAASTLDRWDTYKYGSTGASTGESDNKAIFLAADTGTQAKTLAMNNCRAVTWEPELAADDMLRGSMTFKFSPETSLGAANLKTSALAPSVAFFSW
jgi:hypothetical protein